MCTREPLSHYQCEASTGGDGFPPYVPRPIGSIYAKTDYDGQVWAIGSPGPRLKLQGQPALDTLKDQFIPHDPSQPIEQFGRQLDDDVATAIFGVLAGKSLGVEVSHGHVLVT